MKAILELLKSLSKPELLLIVDELLRENKITYHELTELHIKHLEDLEKGQSERFLELQKRATHIFFDYKKNRDTNIKDMMHWLLDEGILNTTHEYIDKHK